MTKLYTLVIVFLVFSFTASANVFLSALDSLKGLSSSEEFLAAFPYKKCINDGSDITIKKLEDYKAAVNEAGFNGDLFLMEYFNHYCVHNPTDFKDLKSIEERLRLGELMNYSQQYMPDSVFVYMAIGDLLLSNFSDSIQSMVDHKKINVKDYKIKYALDRLAGNKYFIDIPVSNYTKLFNYAKEGRWSYIWTKINSTYKKQFYTALFGFILFLFAAYKGFKFIRKRKKNK